MPLVVVELVVVSEGLGGLGEQDHEGGERDLDVQIPLRYAVRNVGHVGLVVGEHGRPGRLGVEAVHGPVVVTGEHFDRHSPGQTTKHPRAR